jgi:hypothetical protein
MNVSGQMVNSIYVLKADFVDLKTYPVEEFTLIKNSVPNTCK